MKTYAITILTLLLVPLLYGNELHESQAWSEDDALRLKLELITLRDNDLQNAQLLLKVSNVGTNALVLDKFMRAGFSLRFETDLSEQPVYSDERDVSQREVSKLERPKQEGTRFVRLEPGGSLSRTINLSKPQPTVCEGHGTDSGSVHHGFYYESVVQYVVPPEAKELLVTAWYERGVWKMATAEFAKWHGQSAEESGIWRGRARSNTLLIREHDERQDRPNLIHSGLERR